MELKYVTKESVPVLSWGVSEVGECDFEMAADGTLAFVSPTWTRLLGFDSDESIGLSVFDFIHEDDVLFAKSCLAFGGEHEQSLRFCRKNGESFMVGAACRKFPDGRIWGHFNTGGQFSTRSQLAAQGLEFDALLSSSPDAMLVLERSGTILLANGQVEKMFGYEKSELINRDMGLLLPSRIQNYYHHLLIEVFRAPPSTPRHVFGRRRDGTEFPVDITLNPLRLDERDAIVLALRDVTEREALNAELRSRTEALEREIAERQRVEVELRLAQKLEAVGQLAAGVAHEINTPLQYVGDSLAYVAEACEGLIRLAKSMHVLMSAPSTNEQTLRYLRAALDDADWNFSQQELPRAVGRATEGIRRVTEIVTSMRDLSHPDRAEMEEANVVPAIRVAARLSASQLGDAGEIRLHLPRQVIVQCHSGALKQALVNLIVNAAHAVRQVHDETGAKGYIDIHCIETETDVVITVRDTGGGIPESASSRVFDPFFTTKEVGRGTGQGLAIARAIVVERHGGSLNFETKAGEGTTFRLTLPRTQLKDREQHQ